MGASVSVSVSVALRAFAIVAVVALPGATQCDLAWRPGVGGANHYVFAVAGLPDGGLAVGGSFSTIGALTNAYVAVWRDGVWSHLGGGVQGGGLIGAVQSILVLPNGELVAGGIFQIAGGVAVNHVARWDGAAWHALGGGITGGYGYTWIDEMVAMPNGDIVVAGRFYGPVPWLARWNGSTWSAVGNGGWEGTEGLAVGDDAALYVAYNTSAGARVMRWDGATWSQLGAGSASWRVLELEVTLDGELLAAGYAPPLARWTGSQWLSFPGLQQGDQVHGLESLPGGELIVAGTFAAPLAGVARWNGAAWQPVAGGLASLGANQILGLDAATLRNGSVAIGGWFDFAGGQPAPKVAIAEPTCPASAVSYGTGCVGGGGAVQLVATRWPMLGGTMLGRTTGLPPSSLAVGVFGFTPIQVPLASGHPAGLPGCDVLVADEILIEFLVGSGAVVSSIDVPLQTALVGTTFYHQVVPVELAATGAIQALTSSNALALTIGSY